MRRQKTEQTYLSRDQIRHACRQVRQTWSLEERSLRRLKALRMLEILQAVARRHAG